MILPTIFFYATLAIFSPYLLLSMLTKILGIIGGGQLGMMITEAAKKMPEHISKIIVLDPTENCPAAQVGAEQILADFKDKDAIVDLANKSDIITYEIESGDSDILKSIEKKYRGKPIPRNTKNYSRQVFTKIFLNGK